MAKAEAPKTPLLRDQQRALHAYDAVSSVQKAQQKDYQIAVKNLGANILRSGLCAAIASVQRLNSRDNRRGDVLLGHLACAGIPGLEGATAQNLAQRVRGLDADSYMLATRELLSVATWLKRAVQATFEEI